MELRAGQRVMVGGRLGTVAYVRMAPPDYRQALAVSVVMDDLKKRRGYSGTLWPVQHVALAPEGL